MERTPPIPSQEVASVYKNLPEDARACLLHIRTEIFKLAAETPDIGSIEESLKWGEVSYATVTPKTGTPVRLSYRPKLNKCLMLVHCGTSLIDDFKQQHTENIEFEKNRAVVFSPKSPLPDDILRSFLKTAFTYHSRKKASL